MEREYEEQIVSAAIYAGNAIISLPRPARHHTIIQVMDLEMHIGQEALPQSQGFLTSYGRFVGRVEAYYIAVKSEQLQKSKDTPELFSEDLW